MQEHDADYCDFREVTAVVMTWNAGASKPTSLRHDERDANFFRELLQPQDPPDILVFGFQELVDLEDKKVTASKLSISYVMLQRLTYARELFQEQQEKRRNRTGAHEPSVSCLAGSPCTFHRRTYAALPALYAITYCKSCGALYLHLRQNLRTVEDT